MTERLKQIWGGFTGVTTRHLTGEGVDNIAVPHRHEWQAEELQFLPENYPSPSYVAFEKLKARLAVKEKKAMKAARRHGETAELAPPPAEAAFNGELKPVKDLIRGLMSTEARVARSEYDYADFLADQPQKKRGLFSAKTAKAPKPVKSAGGARKKFLGLF